MPSGPYLGDRFADQITQGRMQRFVSGADVRRIQLVTASGDIADLPTGFTNKKNTGGYIPGVQAVFPISVVTACGNLGEIQCGGTIPANA